MTVHLELADALVIAEQLLGIPAEALAMGARISLLESALHAPSAGFGGIEAYPDLAEKSAVLCGHIAKNHGLPDANKRVGFLCMLEFLGRNEYEWTPPPGDGDGEVTDRMVRALAAGDLAREDVAAFAEWVRECADIPLPALPHEHPLYGIAAQE